MNMKQKREQLKQMKKEARKAALRGKYGWSDLHRHNQISELQREIRVEQSSQNDEMRDGERKTSATTTDQL
jgi:hypothetical protein